MESVEAKIKAFLNGEVKDDPEKEFLNIDYSLDQQNYELSMFALMQPDFVCLNFTKSINCLFQMQEAWSQRVLQSLNPKLALLLLMLSRQLFLTIKMKYF